MADALGRLRIFRHSNAWIFGTMLFSALLSLTASFVLSVDALELARDPAASLPTCSASPTRTSASSPSRW